MWLYSKYYYFNGSWTRSLIVWATLFVCVPAWSLEEERQLDNNEWGVFVDAMYRDLVVIVVTYRGHHRPRQLSLLCGYISLGPRFEYIHRSTQIDLVAYKK